VDVIGDQEIAGLSAQPQPSVALDGDLDSDGDDIQDQNEFGYEDGDENDEDDDEDDDHDEDEEGFFNSSDEYDGFKWLESIYARGIIPSSEKGK
jgi:hypothetical protein